MKVDNKDLNFGTDLIDVDSILECECKVIKKSEDSFSPESKLMNDKQIREFWECLSKPKKGERVDGIPDTYEEFYEKMRASQEWFRQRVLVHD